MRISVVIPAYNEAPTIAGVVREASKAALVDDVIVVDNGSQDETARLAAAGGARLISHRSGGKGEAMLAGVRATDAEVIVFLDADLLGLRSEHVDADRVAGDRFELTQDFLADMLGVSRTSVTAAAQTLQRPARSCTPAARSQCSTALRWRRPPASATQ
ncbi:MAG: glycosyltransferase [Actinomycetota bacterium]|nr:glycosyltransferase [Actinomycetota bacterium]